MLDPKIIIKELERYMEKERINKSQLGERLGWSPSEIGDVINNRSPIGIKRLLHISHKLGIKFETEYGETMVAESPPIYLTKDDEEIVEMMKPLTKKDKQELKEFIAFLKAKQVKAG